MAEFETDVRVEDVVIRDEAVSSAVEDPLRANVLDMLGREELTVGDIHDRLAARGYDRTENTVRHHVNALRDAGLVEVARLEEGRGGTKKFYRANTVVLSYALPEGGAETVDAVAEDLRPEVADLLADLRADHAEEVASVVSEMAPCEHCETQKYEEYVLLTVLRRALVRELYDE